jgi:hypothetical protein
LTSLILLLSRPVINVGLARSPQPLVSLAAWPVILGVLFLGRSVAVSYQEAVIALLEDRQSLAALKRFTFLLAGALLLAYALFVATPLIRAWFGVVAGLTPPFVEFSLLPTVIIAVLPAVSVLISWRRGLLVYLRRTPEITRSVLLNVSILIATLIGVRAVFPVSGAVLAAAALTASVLGEWLYLRFRSRATKGLLWDRLG